MGLTAVNFSLSPAALKVNPPTAWFKDKAVQVQRILIPLRLATRTRYNTHYFQALLNKTTKSVGKDYFQCTERKHTSVGAQQYLKPITQRSHLSFSNKDKSNQLTELERNQRYNFFQRTLSIASLSTQFFLTRSMTSSFSCRPLY